MMRDKNLPHAIAETLEVISRMRNSARGPREDILLGCWEERLEKIMDSAPSGSGIDNGTKLDETKSGQAKLVFTFGYHHMNEHGFYDGWTDHTAVVTPSFNGFNLKITGRDRNQIKDYLYDVYAHWLRETNPAKLNMDPVLKHDCEAMADQGYHKTT